jgi:photosystem II stability/assembly factor-like uncharacterized protein
MRRAGTALLLAVLVGAVPLAYAQDASFDEQVQALRWRNVGPFLGGRGSTVVGHPTDRNVFWFGHSSGGLWKTEDAGLYWMPVGDGQFNVGAIGAIALHEKNSDIMYVGTGEPQLRQSVSWGDGMYKTVDGGETWRHIGLKEARHISRVRIHPDDPDLVYVGSMGHAFGPNDERGVFRTKDGGKTWDKILFKSENTGVIDLMMGPADPKVLFAAMFEFERKAWGAKTGGPESGLWRSLDGGDTWEDITRNPGMPEGQMGRIGIAMSKDDPERVWALIDSETKQGLYRSDDLGKTWRFVSNFAQIIARPFYFYHLYADPQDADHLWAPANKLYHSPDAGENWILEPGGKDDYHDIWIDPTDSNRMIAVHDGGAQVTLTGGKSWSTFANQPTTQFYRLHIDDQFPYNLYSNPQDTVTFKVPSASRWGGISNYETVVVGNGETAPAIPHPTNPDIVYTVSSGYPAGGGFAFTINNLRTGQNEVRPIWPESTFGSPATEFKYRFNWQFPFFLSSYDPKTIYAAGNVVFRSRDEGMTWEKISDDLTLDLQDKQQLAGTPWMGEYFGQEIFSTIRRMAESPHEQGTVWVGSDDGLVHLTRDAGETWKNVTPPNLPELAAVYEIEPSPHDPATAYIAMTRYRTANDYSPYLLRTGDYGKTWTWISESFPEGEITRTIREDPVRKGLLFVGTETGVFVSIDDGAEWRRLNLNLPRVRVDDIKLKNADLVIATHGRGFWILDDIGPLRQYSPELAAKKAHLFEIEPHTRFGYNWWMDYGGGPPSDEKYFFVQNTRAGHTFYERGMVEGMRHREFIDAGDARPLGVIIYYLLSDQAEEVSLSILDAQGNEIRTFGKDEIPTQRFSSVDARGYGKDDVTGQPKATVSKGLNRFVWDMRYPSVTQAPGRPPVVIKPIAKPGTFKVRLTVDSESQTQPFELKISPNESYTREETDAKFDFWMQIHAKAEEGMQAVLKARAAKEKVATASSEQAAAVVKICDDLEGAVLPVGTTLVEIINERAKLVPKLTWLHNLMETSEGPPNQAMREVFAKVAGEMDAKIATFEAELQKRMED